MIDPGARLQIESLRALNVPRLTSRYAPRCLVAQSLAGLVQSRWEKSGRLPTKLKVYGARWNAGTWRLSYERLLDDDAQPYSYVTARRAKQRITTGISMSKNAEGRPLIAYNMGRLLKVAACTPVGTDSCGAATTLILHDAAGFTVSLTLGSDNKPLLAFFDQAEDALTVARCNDSTCSAATPGAQVRSAASQFSLGITGETPGLGLVAYRHPNNDLLATEHCSDLACSTFSP